MPPLVSTLKEEYIPIDLTIVSKRTLNFK